jgi:hypothetical protein
LFVPWCRYGGSDVCFRMNHNRLRPTARTFVTPFDEHQPAQKSMLGLDLHQRE